MISQPPTLDDTRYQDEILKGVSRTFALTIPQLPEALRQVIGNAYLLCRITDTIEDDNALTSEQTRYLSDMFSEVVCGHIAAEQFVTELFPLLSDHTIPAEHDLIKHTPAVIRVTHSFNPVQRRALERCVRIMSRGMADYQDTETLDGLKDLPAMNLYCYYVAGVVGEMLTELFCDYSPEINRNKSELMKLSASFGQGLQMTNILKDIWDDRKRGACWLPQDIFLEKNVILRDLQPNELNPGFQEGLAELIGVAKKHLHNALNYTCLIPPHEKGIRRFCLWALGMAILTLKKINRHRSFNNGQQVKITRNTVKATVLTTSIFAGNDWILNCLFNIVSRQLPDIDISDELFFKR
ncbi:phytoene/squalene synthase family protein [Nitrosomonas sp.]|uniref:phytoene/squalene synthase family protein n=1 Tax=Nitrosomonas sp. TaxID=42353 RepID=UPI001E09D6DC|nr:phytoene/squalene synthase family protein [Nitrosomonas sp.]MCB1950101.1 phytoene/squalene synthase family protein [Nitrosomonas sp.]MCP5242723.1 phytoene/squalene synthase family protein [Burkholderiales bacterium]MDR4515137.1 phytoene/squalene synthase family protein [Nitrosomonas sp.]